MDSSIIRHAGLVGLSFFLILGMVHAATITGTAYDGLTLEPLGNTVITIDTQPAQTKLSKDGQYAFTIGPGDYTIRASYSERGILLMDTNQTISITGEGTFVVDLIMLPTLNGLPDDPLPDDEPLTMWEQVMQTPLIWMGIVGTLILGAGYAVLHVKQSGNIPKSLPETQDLTHVERLTEQMEQWPKPFSVEALDKYAVEVIHHLRRGGNRMTQKDLRSHITIGEAKVSLIVSELESYGLIKKIKKGRGNILILTEKGRELEMAPPPQTETPSQPPMGA
ncbi:MAG: winged helix DNA-binding protein [Candidatus Diapherotrites archaeon]|nr:winged helix DNA-binding protein [Candidatus Diapherotrites archaeon]MDZ4256568.1 winged helix DNA-binding protein [archaeon]